MLDQLVQWASLVLWVLLGLAALLVPLALRGAKAPLVPKAPPGWLDPRVIQARQEQLAQLEQSEGQVLQARKALRA